MFLATTALSEFWDKDQEIICLGPWCLPYDRRSEWCSLNYHVLPSPWDDRERFYKAAQYLDEGYERLLEQLAGYLAWTPVLAPTDRPMAHALPAFGLRQVCSLS